MRLHRKGNWVNYFAKNSVSCRAKTSAKKPRHWKVTATFPRFGNGAQRRSTFQIEIGWQDVEVLIRKSPKNGASARHDSAAATIKLRHYPQVWSTPRKHLCRKIKCRK